MLRVGCGAGCGASGTKSLVRRMVSSTSTYGSPASCVRFTVDLVVALSRPPYLSDIQHRGGTEGVNSEPTP